MVSRKAGVGGTGFRGHLEAAEGRSFLAGLIACVESVDSCADAGLVGIVGEFRVGVAELLD
jgi:hypothetical protein